MRSRQLAVSAAIVLLAGCGGGGSSNPSSTQAPATAEAEFYPVATSTQAVVTPFPYNGLFAGSTAPTLNIPNAADAAYISAVNQLDGFSTIGNIYFDIPAVIDYSNVGSHIVIVNQSTLKPLAYGTDFTIQQDDATEVNPSTGAQQAISAFRARVFIELLKPLAPATTYWVGVTSGIKTTAGGAIVAGPEFQIASSATPVAQQTSSFLSGLASDQISALETVRSSLIYPTIAGLGTAGVNTSDLVLAWPFTTQTIGKSLTAVNDKAVVSPITVANTALSTTSVVDIPGDDIYAGTMAIPYYQQNSGGDPHSTVPLTTYWQADASAPDTNASFQGQPCSNFQASASTTGCYPVPVARSTEVVPILIAVPNADSNHTKPPTGWPVVIFQHPLSADRTYMLILAPALAAQGFAVVAMDMPLHGVTDTTNVFYQNQLFANTVAANLMTGERTFNLDLENNTTGVKGTPDGVIDPSGTWILNLSSPLTMRDNFREASADLMTLSKSLGTVDLTQDGTPQLDTSQIRFGGMSLGSVIAIPYLAYAPQIGAASLAVPGGGILKLLDASVNIGPYVSSYTASIGITEGTDAYETFLRYAQTAVDDSDPVNYAATARALHPIHMMEVLNDLVMSNAAPASPGTSTEDKVTVASFLAGGTPLYGVLGLKLEGPINVTQPTTTPTLIQGANLGEVVQFNQGVHASLLDPTAVPGATVEMQREMANFLATNGTCLPIEEDCPAQ